MIIGVPPYLLLLVVILLIYLLDCIVVLYANEAIVKPHESGWRVDFGSRQGWIAGKRIYLLNPLTPLAATYRTHWQVGEASARVDEGTLARCADHTRLIARLDARIAMTAWVVLIILPLAMMLRGSLGFLIGAAISWVLVIVLLVRFFASRVELELGWGEFSLIAFECLACPPCAVNLLRKLSLRYRMNIGLVGLTVAMPEDRAAIVFERIGEQVDAHLVMMDDETPEYAQTSAWRELLRIEYSRLIAKEVEPT